MPVPRSARGLKKMDTICPLAKHVLDYHSQEGQIQDKPDRFTMKVKKVCKGNLQRLLTESVMIDTSDESRLMNSKTEFGKKQTG